MIKSNFLLSMLAITAIVINGQKVKSSTSTSSTLDPRTTETTDAVTTDTPAPSRSTETTSLPPTWPIDATEENCMLLSYNTRSCSCGSMCSSFTREYFAIAPAKCDNQILRTGEFGAEPCSMNDFIAKDMSKNYTCIVLPCDDGEFAFSDQASTLNVSAFIITFLSMFVCYQLV